jgi:glutamyl-tRNA reductase
MISKLLVLKWAVEKNLNEHLDIIQKILSLNEEEASEFTDWYNNNRTRKAIEDIYGAVESRAIRHTKTEKLSTLFMGHPD